MIIQSLCTLYDQLEHGGGARGEANPIAPFGYSRQKVSFVIVLERDGRLHAVEDARTSDTPEADSKRKPKFAPRSLIVPAVPGRTVAIQPGFLCDSSTYMLGLVAPAKPGSKAGDPDRVQRCFEAFRDRHLAAERAIEDPGFHAVCAFLNSWSPSRAAEFPILAEVVGGFGVFQLRGEQRYVHESEPIGDYWSRSLTEAAPDRDEPTSEEGVAVPSLVSGRVEAVARLHEPAIKGVLGAQTSGAKLASFNCPSFESYGKSQTYNAPVGARDAFKYCTALNHLLASDRHRVRLGDTTIVFWTDNPKAIELFGQIVGGAGRGGQDEASLASVRRWGEAARRGVHTDLGDLATPFFILGLSPNAARLSVRLWISSTVGKVMANLASHAEGLDLDDAPDGYSMPTLAQIARETVAAKSGWPDDERIPSRLVGELGRAVLMGLPYPASLLGATISRIRTDGWVNANERTEGVARIGHRRASIIAACLRRRGKEISMSLDETHPSEPYQLGRLFALLDTVAEDASGRSVNRRDKYFAAASSNPVTVFPRLVRLSTFDLKKIGAENGGFRVVRERQIQAVCDRIRSFPSSLTLEEQGLFCLGYYQQRQRIFAPAPDAAAV